MTELKTEVKLEIPPQFFVMLNFPDGQGPRPLVDAAHRVRLFENSKLSMEAALNDSVGKEHGFNVFNLACGCYSHSGTK
jgi:hypothetical protein